MIDSTHDTPRDGCTGAAPPPSVPPGFGLVVLRPEARGQQIRILESLRARFDVHRVVEIEWSGELAARSWYRLTGESLRQGTPTSLLLVSLVDASPAPGKNPKKDLPPETAPNMNLTAAVAEATTWTGAPSSIRASASPAGARRDLMLLLGSDPATHLAGPRSTADGGTNVENLQRDLTGARGWATPAELFHTLNRTARYIVLRNFEDLPGSLHVGSHEDVDLLTDDYPDLARVMNARPNVRCIPHWGGPYWVNIAGQDMWFDLRFVGDHYYDPRWAQGLLDRREWNPQGFYAPSPADYFDSLAYHAIVHKDMFSPDYKVRLVAMARTLGRPGWEPAALEDPARVRVLLDRILKHGGYRYCRPRDVNVFYNFAATGHMLPQARRKLAGLARKAIRLVYRVQRRGGGLDAAPGAGVVR